MLNGESRMTDTIEGNLATKRISKDITKRKRSNLAYAIHAVLTEVAKHKKSKKCRRFVV